jgi:Tfp pilus assembly protein PilV
VIRNLRHRLIDDRGFTVIELVIASGLFFIILLAVLSTLDTGTKSERISQARQEALVSLRGAMTQMTKELRQAISVDADPSKSNASRVDMQTLLGGVQHHVVYQVVGTAPNAILQRSVDEGPTTQLADRILAPLAFCYQYDEPNCLATSPTADLSSIRVSLEISPVVFSAGAVTLATDIELRNI